MSQRYSSRNQGRHASAKNAENTGRWQDWLVLVLGAITALSPLWLSVSVRGGWVMVVLGILLALSSLWSFARPDSTNSEYAHVGLGALLFIAPWVFRYTDGSGACWTSWIAGVLAVMAGLGARPAAAAAQRLPDRH